MTKEFHIHPDDFISRKGLEGRQDAEYVRSISSRLDREGKRIRRGAALPLHSGSSRPIDQNYDARTALVYSDEVLQQLRSEESWWEQLNFLPDDVFTRPIPEIEDVSTAPSSQARIDGTTSTEIQQQQPIRFQLLDSHNKAVVCPGCGMADRWTTLEPFEPFNESEQDDNADEVMERARQTGILSHSQSPERKLQIIKQFVHLHILDPLITKPIDMPTLSSINASEVNYAVVTDAQYGTHVNLGRRYEVCVPPGESPNTRNRVLK